MGEISQKRERPEMPEGVEYMREQVSQAGGNGTMRTKRTELAAEREELDAGEFPGSKKGVQEVAVQGSLFSLEKRQAKPFSVNHKGGPGKGSRKASKIWSERGYKLGVLSSGRGPVDKGRPGM